jgi:hypothetical protein
MDADTDLANQIIDEWIAGQSVPPTAESILADWEYQASERDPRDPMRDRIYMEAQVIRARIAALEAERDRLLSRVADLEGQLARVNDNGNKITAENELLRSALLRLGRNGGYSQKYLDMVLAECASGKFPVTMGAGQ